MAAVQATTNMQQQQQGNMAGAISANDLLPKGMTKEMVAQVYQVR